VIQTGQVAPEQEDHRAQHAEQDGGDDEAPAAVPVGDVPDGEEAGDDAERVDGEDDRDRQRREPVARLVKGVEGRRHSRVADHHEEGEGDRPEADRVTAVGSGFSRTEGKSESGHEARVPLGSIARNA
jgi:hypothetical protein